jgi:hypothetical protein
LWVLFGTPLFGENQGASKSENQPTYAEDLIEEDDDPGFEVDPDAPVDEAPIDIEVPPELRGRGYILRTEDQDIPLNRAQVRYQSSSWRSHIDLISSDGRILSTDDAVVDEFVFDHLPIRVYRLGMYFGATNATDKIFKDVYQTGSFSEFNFDFNYQPQAIGYLLSFASLNKSRQTRDKTKSTYNSNQYRLALTYEVAPFHKRASFLSRIHFMGFLGAFYGQHEVEIEKDQQRTNGKGGNTGLWGGIETRYPVINFWVGLKASVASQTIKIDDVNLDGQVIQTTLQLGGTKPF